MIRASAMINMKLTATKMMHSRSRLLEKMEGRPSKGTISEDH